MRILIPLLALLPWSWYLIRDLSPWMDLFAIGMPLMLLSAFAFLLVWSWRWPRRLWPALLSWLLFSAAVMLLPQRPLAAKPPQRGITLVVANTQMPHRSVDEVLDLLLERRADLLVVVENSTPLHRKLRDRFPHHLKFFPDWPRYDEAPAPLIGLYSRFPLELLEQVDSKRPTDGIPGIRAVVRGPEPFVLWALHVPRPTLLLDSWSAEFPTHGAIVERTVRAIATEELPVVVAGDLNSPDRGRSYRLFTSQLEDGMRGGWRWPTSVKSFLFRLLHLRIDHILIDKEWCASAAQRFPLIRSDHRGVSAIIGPCR